MQTYIVYISLLLVSFFFARRAEIKEDKKYVIYIITIFALIAGLRKFTVGIDTKGYMDAIDNIIVGNLRLAYGLEWSFRYICYGISYLIKDSQWFLMIFAFVSNAFIILRIWDFREYASFSVSVIAYYIMFYMMSLNLMRQFVAIAIIFYATRYLEKGQHIKYVCYILVATLFHRSSLIAVLFVLFNITAWKFLTKKQKVFLGAVICCSPVLGIYIYKSMNQYLSYFEESDFNIGAMIIIKCLLLMASYVMVDKASRVPLSKDSLVRRGYIQRTSATSYALGLLLTGTEYIWKFVSRIGLYFYVFETVYVGIVFKQKNTRNNIIFKLLFIMILAYQFMINMIGNGQGQHPYLFFWQ